MTPWPFARPTTAAERRSERQRNKSVRDYAARNDVSAVKRDDRYDVKEER